MDLARLPKVTPTRGQEPSGRLASDQREDAASIAAAAAAAAAELMPSFLGEGMSSVRCEELNVGISYFWSGLFVSALVAYAVRGKVRRCNALMLFLAKVKSVGTAVARRK